MAEREDATLATYARGVFDVGHRHFPVIKEESA